MASSQSLPGIAPSEGRGDTSNDPLTVNPLQRSNTTSPNPSRQYTPIPRSVQTSREPSPNRTPFLNEGLAKKVRIVRTDALTHPTDMLVCPSDPSLSSNWCSLTAEIHEAAGPKLSTTISNRYSAGISNPPAKLWWEYSDVNDIESPFKSFFNTIKHSSSFEMAKCDWLAHSCVPSYSREEYTTGEGVGSPGEIWIQERNHAKYNSVYLSLKKAHLVALVHWTRTFTVAIPQFQHDGEFYTPRDDAILTLAAVVDFFNHPVWGARRCNILERVDIVIDPTEEGIPYVEAYNFAWHVMNMQVPEREIPPAPGSRRGFLRRPFPAYRPSLPARDPYANYAPPTTKEDDVLLTTETPDNSQQVAESQEMDLLEQAKMEEDGDSIFGDFMENAVTDFHGSEVGNSPFNREETLHPSGTSLAPTPERRNSPFSPIQTNSNDFTPYQHSQGDPISEPSFSESRKTSKSPTHIPSLSPSSTKSLSPPPPPSPDPLEKPPYRSSTPSPESNPKYSSHGFKKIFKSPTDGEFTIAPLIPGLTLLKTAVTNASPEMSPVSDESSGRKANEDGKGAEADRLSGDKLGNMEGTREGEIMKPTITVTPPNEVRDRVVGLRELSKSSETKVSSPLTKRVIYSGNEEGMDGEEDVEMLEVTREESLSRVSEGDSTVDEVFEEDKNFDPDSQAFANEDSDSEISIDLNISLEPITEEEEEASIRKENATQDKTPRSNLLLANKRNSDSDWDSDFRDSNTYPSSSQEPEDDPYHSVDTPPDSDSAAEIEVSKEDPNTFSNQNSSQEPEPEDDPYHSVDTPPDSDSASESEAPKEEHISPLSPEFPNSPKVLKREVAGLKAVGHGLDGSYWSQRSTRTRKRKRGE